MWRIVSHICLRQHDQTDNSSLKDIFLWLNIRYLKLTDIVVLVQRVSQTQLTDFFVHVDHVKGETKRYDHKALRWVNLCRNDLQTFKSWNWSPNVILGLFSAIFRLKDTFSTSSNPCFVLKPSLKHLWKLNLKLETDFELRLSLGPNQCVTKSWKLTKFDPL